MGGPVLPGATDVRAIGTLGPTMIWSLPMRASAVASCVLVTPTSSTGWSNGRAWCTRVPSASLRRTMPGEISNVTTVMGEPGAATLTDIASSGIPRSLASLRRCASAYCARDLSSTKDTSNLICSMSGAASPSSSGIGFPSAPAFAIASSSLAPGFSSVTTEGARRWLSPSVPNAMYASGMAAMCSFSPSLPFFFCRRSPVLSPAGSHATLVRGSSTPVIFCASSYSVSSTAFVSLSDGCREAFSLFFSSMRTSNSSSLSYLKSSRPSSLRARMAVRGPMAARWAGRKFSSSSSSLSRRVLSTSS
mmetsp:Transcript_7501/g.19209  ORF Transcript_7501/g.19209 Transcript_7501/m.19209 type:complete len:305 (-) Transcript_7501:2175-3089(-)